VLQWGVTDVTVFPFSRISPEILVWRTLLVLDLTQSPKVQPHLKSQTELVGRHSTWAEPSMNPEEFWLTPRAPAMSEHRVQPPPPPSTVFDEPEFQKFKNINSKMKIAIMPEKHCILSVGQVTRHQQETSWILWGWHYKFHSYNIDKLQQAKPASC